MAVGEIEMSERGLLSLRTTPMTVAVAARLVVIRPKKRGMIRRGVSKRRGPHLRVVRRLRILLS